MDQYTKKEIRNLILEQREKIDGETRRDWDKDIFLRLVSSEFYKNSSVIFAFVSFNSEVNTHEIIKQALRDSKTICVPRIRSKEKGIEIFKINSLEELRSGYFGILEPNEACPAVDSESIDLILMPGVAFDRHGGRVGYGRGYYDRFLSGIRKRVDKIALAYHFQVLESVPMEEFDIKIDGVITNEEIIHCEV